MDTSEFNAGVIPAVEFSSHIRKRINTSIGVLPQKLVICASLMSHLARMLS